MCQVNRRHAQNFLFTIGGVHLHGPATRSAALRLYSPTIVRMATADHENLPADRQPSVTFTPIEPLRAHEYVAEQLRHHIVLGLIPVGAALPTERELAGMLQVGRNTIK